MIKEKEILLKQFIQKTKLCSFCINTILKKPCIFVHNNDAHLCPVVLQMYKYSKGGVK